MKKIFLFLTIIFCIKTSALQCINTIHTPKNNLERFLFLKGKYNSKQQILKLNHLEITNSTLNTWEYAITKFCSENIVKQVTLNQNQIKTFPAFLFTLKNNPEINMFQNPFRKSSCNINESLERNDYLNNLFTSLIEQNKTTEQYILIKGKILLPPNSNLEPQTIKLSNRKSDEFTILKPIQNKNLKSYAKVFVGICITISPVIYYIGPQLLEILKIYLCEYN